MEYSVIIVLANLMDINGVLNDESSDRMDLAISKYKESKAPFIITCGWNYRSDTSIKIADAMKEYAVNTGNIPSANVLTELNSRDTVGDAIFTKNNFAIQKGLKKLLIITSDYHSSRVKEIFSFIYGKEYEIDVKGAYTSYCKDKQEGERKSLLAFYETFKNVEAGDNIKINKCLSSIHPFYNGDIYSKIK